MLAKILTDNEPTRLIKLAVLSLIDMLYNDVDEESCGTPARQFRCEVGRVRTLDWWDHNRVDNLSKVELKSCGTPARQFRCEVGRVRTLDRWDHNHVDNLSEAELKSSRRQ